MFLAVHDINIPPPLLLPDPMQASCPAERTSLFPTLFYCPGFRLAIYVSKTYSLTTYGSREMISKGPFISDAWRTDKKITKHSAFFRLKRGKGAKLIVMYKEFIPLRRICARSLCKCSLIFNSAHPLESP
jgi:hypothetical protein